MMQNDRKFSTPDSRYSWAIATACHIMYFLIYGMFRISGALFTEIVTSYNIDRQLASVPFAMASSVKCLLGPVVGCFIETLGFRPVLMMGSIFSFLGLGGCFFAKNTVMFCVFWGLFYGIGDALTISALPQLIYLYFEKHVSTATGFAIIGAPIAGFVLSPIADIFLKEYGLSGTFLLLSGIVLHTLPVSMFLKEPNPKPSHSNVFCIKRKNGKARKINGDGKIHPSSYNLLQKEITLHPKTLSKTNIQSNVERNETGEENNQNSSVELSNLSMSVELNENAIEMRSPASGTNGRKTSRWYNTIKILWNPAFLLIAFPRCLHMLSFIIIPTFMVDFSIDKGFSSSLSAYILMSLYGADLCGKIAFGWVTDRGYMTVAGLTSLCCLVTAASFATIVWPSTFTIMVTAAVFLGVCIGLLSALSPRLVSEYIEADNQITAMTSGDILMGPVAFLIPSLIGYFRDTLGSYNWLMYVMSIALTASSVLLLFLPKLSSWKISKRRFLT